MKKITAILMATIMIFSLSTVVSANQTLTTQDALTVLRIAAGVVTATAEQTALYDLNKDGAITTADAAMVLRVSAGLPAKQTFTKDEIIQFGGYDWRVLDVQSGRMLIITDKIIDSRYYNNAEAYSSSSYIDGRYYGSSESFPTTWADSEMRAYLNVEFLGTFSDTDRARIRPVTNRNPDNPWYGTDGGEDTIDRIFLLSLDDVLQYFGDSGEIKKLPEETARSFFTDQYDKNRIAYHVGGVYEAGNWRGLTAVSIAAGSAWRWWLRSPGADDYNAMYVLPGDGSIHIYGHPVGGRSTSFHYGIRPAMWITV